LTLAGDRETPSNMATNLKDMPFDGNPEKIPDNKRQSTVGGSDLHDVDMREEDFMTRSGLNMKSFQRSKSVLKLAVMHI